MPTDSNQTTIPGIARVASTRDRRFTIHFPLPPARAEVKRPEGTHASVILRNMNRWLNAGHPVVCPLTGHLVMVYRRGLSASQVHTLRRLRQAMLDTGAVFVHLRQFSGRRDGDLAKMALWNLVEARRDEAGSRGRGFWKITDRGKLWLFGDVRIPRQMAVLNGECLGAVDDRDLIGPTDVDPEFSRERLLSGAAGTPVGAGA